MSLGDTAPHERRRRVRISAPLRVDCGNALDIEPIAAVVRGATPCTVNVAIKPRVEVNVERRHDDKIVMCDGCVTAEYDTPEQMRNTMSARLVGSVLGHFQLTGVTVRVDTPVARGSGLGGSGAIAVCLVAAAELLTDPDLELPGRSACALLARRLEVAVTPTAVGMQDHLAAAYGGVSLWLWDHESADRPFSRVDLSSEDVMRGIDERLLVAVTATTHTDGGMTARWVAEADFERDAWSRTAIVTRAMGDAVARADWPATMAALNRECVIRLERWPELMTPTLYELRDAARAAGAGVRFTGGALGGGIWALVEPGDRPALARRWTDILAGHGGELLPAVVDRVGLASA